MLYWRIKSIYYEIDSLSAICFIGGNIMKAQSSTFEGSPMLGPAELSAVAGTRVAQFDKFVEIIGQSHTFIGNIESH